MSEVATQKRKRKYARKEAKEQGLPNDPTTSESGDDLKWTEVLDCHYVTHRIEKLIFTN